MVAVKRSIQENRETYVGMLATANSTWESGFQNGSSFADEFLRPRKVLTVIYELFNEVTD